LECVPDLLPIRLSAKEFTFFLSDSVMFCAWSVQTTDWDRHYETNAKLFDAAFCLLCCIFA
ncbi:hypothetical protein, partial [Enterococcus faecalis]|uniref:hypothetical protein n=1 Tax=Enterococcus faecalis TaxID=1351 RepID=UPI003D6C52A9